MEPETPGDSARLSRTFIVGASQAGPRGRVRLASFLDFFQDSAADHAARLGASVLDLIKKKLTWSISNGRWKVSPLK